MRRNLITLKSVKNYKYAAYLNEKPPEEFWQQGRLMNELWNAMVDFREKFVTDLQLKNEEVKEENKLNKKKEDVRIILWRYENDIVTNESIIKVSPYYQLLS